MAGKLNAKRQRFVEEYLVDLNATQAAIRAGYSKKTAYRQGADLLKNPQIAEAITKANKDRSERTKITADSVIEQLARFGFSDIRKIFDERGSLRSVSDLPDDVAAAVASVEVVTRPGAEIDADGNREVEYVHKIRMVDKIKPLELIGKHLAMWVERHEIEGNYTFSFDIDGAGGNEDD